MRLLHFSDVHVQLPRWRERSLRELGALRALASLELWKGRGRDYDDAADKLRLIARDADELRADHCLLTGDLTQLAMEEEFALARKALAPILPRLASIPGNHDRYPLPDEYDWYKTNKLYERYFPDQPLAPRLLGDDAVLIPVDSAGEVSWPIISHGRVGPAQLDALASALRHPAHAARCKLVLVHHSPTRRGARRDWPLHDLRGAGAFLKTCADNGADAILCGHVHDRFDDAPRPGRPRVICAGSSTERGKEGYWLLEIEKGRLAAVSRRAIGGEPTAPSRSPLSDLPP
jgi:3',5'-cyclic AMP phosphodiesterase CpdA